MNLFTGAITVVLGVMTLPLIFWFMEVMFIAISMK